MSAQPKRFAEFVFESVSSDSFNLYKITSPLVKINGVSVKSSGRFVGGLMVSDTICDTINLLFDKGCTAFDEVQAQIKFSLTGLDYEC